MYLIDLLITASIITWIIKKWRRNCLTKEETISAIGRSKWAAMERAIL